MSYQYDQYGNLNPNGPNPINPANNRLTLGVYDDRGNLTSYGSQRYDYDGLSRQTALNGGYERYLYDGSGERIARVTAPSLGTKLYTISPCRVLDTRFTPPAVTTVPRVVQMSGSCGIPLEASGVVGNLAAIPLGSGGLFRLYPTGTMPATSTLNFNAGQVRANNFQLGLSGNGQLSLSSNTTAEAVVDAVGYFAFDNPTWTVTFRDEANRLASEYTVPPPGTSISRVRNHLYLGNLLVATRNTSGGYTYWASDHLGTPRVGTGSNPETHKYQPFGTEITSFGSLPIKFASMERDLSSGNDFDHARYQSSLLGRFLTPDRIGGEAEDPQTWNRYAYAQANPLKYVDPDGNIAWEVADWASYQQSSRDWVAAYTEFKANPSFGTGMTAALRFTYAAADAAGALLPGIPAVAGTVSRISNEAPHLLSFTKGNFRENVHRLSGVAADKTVEAHHRLPRAFEQQFSRAGINIHDPRFGVLLEKHFHRASASKINERWDEFFRSGPKTKEEILKFLQKVDAEFGTGLRK